MKTRSALISSVLLALLVLLLCLPAAQAQRRRTRTSRRATNPVRRTAEVPVPTPTPSTASASDPTLLSTAEDGAPDDAPPRRATGNTRRGTAAAASGQAPDTEKDQLRHTVTTLSTQINRLSDDLTQMRSDQRAMVDLERLTRAEQRAESLRSQLRDVQDKEFASQERASQIEDEMQPDAIQRRAATVGSLNASAVRDQILRGLEREKERVRKQLDMLNQSRSRLEAAVANADAEVERLRQRVDAAGQVPPATGTTTTSTNPSSPVTTVGTTTTATPSPSPTPPN